MPTFDRGLAEQVTQALTPRRAPEVPEGSRINVHAAVSRFAVLYERIRNAVDYKDEHLLRKSAIRRILSRQLILENDPTVIAGNLIRELIGARYLPNNELSEGLIDETALRVEKYLAVAGTRVLSDSQLSWLRGMIVVEIDELLVDSAQEKALVTFLYERLGDRIRVAGAPMEENDARLQTYIACYRMLLKADDEILGFKLLRAFMPEWLRPREWLADPRRIADALPGIRRRMTRTLAHRLSFKFQRTVKPWAVSLNILRDALTDKPEEAPLLLQKPESLDAAVSRVAERRYREAGGRLRRGAVHATLYLFVTKMLVAFILEVPLENLWYGTVSRMALAINLLFPPVLMFLVSLFISVPGRDNTKRIQENVGVLLSAEGVPTRDIRLPRARGGLSGFLFSLIYAFMFVLTFGLVGAGLFALDFTWLSASIFYFFLCVVSFFAFRLRQAAREYVIVEGRERFSWVILDFISFPILRAGQWLSRSISRLNVFLFFLDFLVEAPFKIFLGVLEEWFAFMKEKKEELQ